MNKKAGYGSSLNILIIEDDKLLRKAMFDQLGSWGHQVRACESLTDAERIRAENTFDLIFTDMRLPDGDGIKYLKDCKDSGDGTEIVVMTAFADVPTAVSALKCGAYDYLTKPFEEEQLEKILRNVGEKNTLRSQVSTLSEMTMSDFDDVRRFDEMIGTSVLSNIFETARRVAESPNTTVLIMGESGTGKGMLAKAIHRCSPRASKPFVDINCSALPEHLVESELFGYEKGAFTDAKIRKPGLLEIAQGGTVFLDEIGDMELNLQGKILKVLEDKEFRRLGSAAKTQVDIRVIAATNRRLLDRVKEGKFREDLYYRLSVVPLVMPPLRDHRESIEPLAHYYLKIFSRQIGRKIEGFTTDAIELLNSYSWPGNVRELKNVIERSVILAQEKAIDEADLHLTAAHSSPQSATPHHKGGQSNIERAATIMSLAEAEKNLITAALHKFNGHKNKAAEALQIHRSTLYKKIEEYGLESKS